MKILHILHRSIPGSHGYAIRSEEIVTKQLAAGLEPMVVTSPSQAPLGELDSEQSELIDGVRYFRTGGRILPPTIEVKDESAIKSALRVFQNVALLQAARKIARKYRPAVIHGHSPFTCGLVAGHVGRWEKIPTVYEMRGLWEDSHTSRHGITERSVRYRTVRFLENAALRDVDLCCVICEALRDEVLARGINPDRIAIVPNGVDVKKFSPGPPKVELQSRLGLQGKVVMGYIGSFFHYEGLNLMVQAMAGLADDFPNLRLLMVGEGEVSPLLKSMTQEAEITDRVIFTGRVPHNQIADFYRLYDFMVLPRLDTRETRLVTPLKPLEIMAMGKSVIASDIGGHKEIVQNRLNGILFESQNVPDLIAKCRDLIENEGFRVELGARSRQWVAANRDWDVLVRKYITVYEGLAGSRRGF
jgi:glycogen synthase